MIQGIYKLAGKNIKISSIYDEVHKMCCDYISDEEPDFEVETSMEDIQFESDKSDYTRAQEGLPEYKYPNPYLETLAVYRKIATEMVKYDTILFHGSAIAVDDEAYLFTASSGTGKSTHTRLWREAFGDRAVMVNDDKPLIKVSEDGVEIFGTPWNGKHHLGGNIHKPLKAICILTRGVENKIRKVEFSEVLSQIYNQTYRPDDQKALIGTLGLLDKIANTIPIYILECNMEPEAANVAYKGMQ